MYIPEVPQLNLRIFCSHICILSKTFRRTYRQLYNKRKEIELLKGDMYTQVKIERKLDPTLYSSTNVFRKSVKIWENRCRNVAVCPFIAKQE